MTKHNFKVGDFARHYFLEGNWVDVVILEVVAIHTNPFTYYKVGRLDGLQDKDRTLTWYATHSQLLHLSTKAVVATALARE